MGRLFTLVLGLMAALAAPGAAASPGAPGRPGATASAAARDSFHGSISASSGAYRGARDRVSMQLSAPGAQSSRRQLTLVFSSPACPGCLRIAGTARGYLAPGPRHNPDTGSRYTITARGRLNGLGITSVTGSVAGTGFVARGYETMQLTLRTARGTVTITARSGQVGGFTSP